MRLSFPVVISLAVITGVIAQDTSPTQAKDAFDKADIPKDLHINFDPKALLKVAFRQKPRQGSKSVPPPVKVGSNGAEVHNNSASEPPEFSLASPVPADIGKGPFVVAIVDPDAPASQNSESPVRRFLGGNFTLNSDGVSLVNNTPAVTEYLPPSPPKGSKPHRCVFLLFKQPQGFEGQKEVKPDTSRSSFNISNFAEKVGLDDPVAGIFMYVNPPQN